jgi:hypothetical protein
LQTLGLVGVGLALSPKGLFAQPSDVGVWRDRVTGFVYTVCNDRRAQAINEQLFRARLEYAPSATDFHSYYSAPYVFVGTTIDPEEVICGNGFEVNRFPFYDVACPCRGVNDLNGHEIRRITNSKEMEYYGCVLAPSSRRMAVEARDHADYLRTISYYPYDPADFNVAYKRTFTGRGRSYIGYHVVHKTLKGPNDKPMGDVLLGTQLSS